jgi:CRP-like cAMP-binding protein
MIGLSALLGADRSGFEFMVQGAGTALRMSVGAFRAGLGALPGFNAVMLRFALAHFEQVAHTAACNSRHNIDQRLARWLLMVHDRVDGDAIPLTHEFLAMMLGVRRAGVTVAADKMRDAGNIRLSRGSLTVINRAGLESVACECYATAVRADEGLLGPRP